ncbi:MAG: peptidoglycan editing factor PgeF [Rickettsiaceae bacterium H1]|nr:peptidoglycan editing factor PgeF [Rickettsiaceae bacterium H1]
MKNYIQSQEFHEQIKHIAHHAFFKQTPTNKELENFYLAKQIHSNRVIEFNSSPSETIEGDAIVTVNIGVNLAVRTADCVPILIIDPDESIISVIHAGWKGAKAGIIENTLKKINDKGGKTQNIIAAIGPCIRQNSYEVSEDFFHDFINEDNYNKIFFTKPNYKYMFDLPGYVKHKLRGLRSVYDCNIDTYKNPKDFSSYRRATEQQVPLATKNISTITLLKSNEGFSKWKSSLKNVKKIDTNKHFYQSTTNYSVNPNWNDNVRIDKLDLHGCTTEEAYETLSNFIRRQFDLGNRSLLIITGKGSGIIRENVYKWLQYSNLNKYVLDFNKAAIKDGGEGAIYLTLKKKVRQ